MPPKLVMYSDGVLPENRPIDERMMRLFDKPKPTVAFISSSADPDGFWFNHKAPHYRALGAVMDLSFDLGEGYDPSLLPTLLRCDGIHLTGGNTFGFLSRLRRNGMIETLREYVAKGGVLIGTSAGAILMTSNIWTSALCGDENSENLTDLSALNLVDFDFLPHFEGGPLENISGERLLYGCPDGAGIVVEGENIELFGPVERFA